MRCIESRIHELLIKHRKTVSIAESCTGGLVSEILTRLPLSSRYFIFGAVVYSNESKKNILRIPSQIITKKGAVSKEVAQKMSESIRRLTKTDFGIGITGIA
ncbi:MAG: nicotinamide-nucleotide amidohydrolase family protein, partial [Candidatus Omnitrophica bacterium]|nr:nicotinamide-nucleotide amidohydrolase family protein [Candidatus Omnitrophota bacterium]